MNPQQIEAAQRIGKLVLETINELKPLGAPSGVLYAGLMTAGCSKSQYDSLIDSLARNGLITNNEDHCLHITSQGETFLGKLQAKFSS
jgi:hypothetical protein